MFRKHAIDTDFTHGPLTKNIFFYTMPIFFSGVLQLLFNAADTIVVGRYAGEEALAAVGSVGALNALLVCLFIGLSAGANVLTARFTGAQDHKAVEETVHTAVTVALIGGIFLAFLGIVAVRPLLILMGSPEDVLDLSVIYVRIIFMGMPIQMLYNFCSATLRAVGDTKRPLYFLTLAGVINVVLNLLFVIVFRMSVSGVALATVISQAVSTYLVIRTLQLRSDAVRLNLRKLRLNKKILLKIIHIGLPSGIQSSTFALSNVLIQSSVNSFGAAAMAGNAAAASIGAFVSQGLESFTSSCTCFVSQNLGAKKPDRIFRSTLTCQLLGGAFTGVLATISCIFAAELLSFYNTDPAVIGFGLERILTIHPFYVLGSIMSVFSGAIRGMGYSILSMSLSLIGVCALRVVWVLGVFPYQPTMTCLMASFVASWILTGSLMGIFFRITYKKTQRKLS